MLCAIRICIAQNRKKIVSIERRIYRRFASDLEKIQASLVTNLETYPVKDISKGGLAVKYMPGAVQPFDSETIVIISISFDRFILSNIPCKTIYDIPTLMEGGSYKGGKIRLCGLKFVNLTKEKKHELDSLLKCCFD